MTRSIEDECIEYQEILMGDVPVKMGIPNIKEYRQKLKAEAASGKKIMRPFTRWNTEKLGASYNTAEKDSAVVWRVLRSEFTPAELVYDVTKPQNYRNTIKASVRKFCAFLIQDKKSPEEDKKWAHETIYSLSRSTRPAKLTDTRRLDNVNLVPRRPLTNEEYKGLLESVTRIKNTYLHAIVGLMFHTGITQVEAVYCAKADIEIAMETGGLRIRGDRMGVRIVSSASAKKFLKILIDYPWEWGILADVLSPDVVDHFKITSAKKKIAVALKRCAESIDMEVGGLTKRIRLILAYRAYKRHNILHIAQYLSVKQEKQVTKVLYAFEDPELFAEKGWKPE